MIIPIGSLFSGIGGLEWGLEEGLRASGYLASTAWQVDCNEYGLAVLQREWPQAQRYRDVRIVGERNLSPVMIMAGGSPCTDLSNANRARLGFQGERSGLWFEYMRIIRELKPAYVVWENVKGALCPTRDKASGDLVPAALGTVISNLWDDGYDALWTTLTAEQVGAPHERLRVFVIAWRRDGHVPAVRSIAPAQHSRELVLDSSAWPANRVEAVRSWEPAREMRSSSVPHHRERIEAIGNCVVPQCSFVVGMMLGALMSHRPAPFNIVVPARSAARMGPIYADWALQMVTHALPVARFTSVNAEEWGPCPRAVPGRSRRSRADVPMHCVSWPQQGICLDGVAYSTHPHATLQHVVACTLEGCESDDTVVQRENWPTPTARDWRSGKSGAETRSRNARPLSEEAAPHGFLNPDWVDALAGFGVGYTTIPAGIVTPRKRSGKVECKL